MSLEWKDPTDEIPVIYTKNSKEFLWTSDEIYNSEDSSAGSKVYFYQFNGSEDSIYLKISYIQKCITFENSRCSSTTFFMSEKNNSETKNNEKKNVLPKQIRKFSTRNSTRKPYYIIDKSF